MQRNLSGTIILVLLASLPLGQAQDAPGSNKEPYPPTGAPPRSLDQPAPTRRPTQWKPVKTEQVSPAEPIEPRDESADREPSTRSKLPVFIVFLGIILLFLRTLPIREK